MKLCPIGFAEKRLEQFVRLLHGAGVQLLVDVRLLHGAGVQLLVDVRLRPSSQLSAYA